MKPEILGSYAKEIYEYAIHATFTRDEADELSQEILYQALLNLPKLKEETSFEPWLWGIARNCTKVFRRKKSKERALYVYGLFDESMEELNSAISGETVCDEIFDEIYDEGEKIRNRIREKIAALSKRYRDIVILHYYDGLTTKQIAQKLAIPEGTVVWRLSEARSKMRKEVENDGGETMENTVLRPKKMKIDIYGSGPFGNGVPFPGDYIDDALSQNILYYCYEKPQNVESLAKLCGVPAYYIEDRVENLAGRNAVRKLGKGKIQTDFIIWTDKYGSFCEEHAAEYLEPVREKILSFLEKMFYAADKLPIYRAGKGADELHYLYGAMAFDRIGRKYGNVGGDPRIPENYDGNCWRYLASMETGKYKRTMITVHSCNPHMERTSYSHCCYMLEGFRHRDLMGKEEIFACESILNPEVSCDEETLADAIAKGDLVRKTDGSFFVITPAFTKAQREQFYGYVQELFEPAAEEYMACIDKFKSAYRKLFPKHLADDVERQCQTLAFGAYREVVKMCKKSGLLPEPDAKWTCDVLVQNR